jgi:ubiquinone/menaquinone biosynthesis C-methylase UbiE
MNEAFRSEVWQKYWLPSVAEWSRAESSVEDICKIFAEHGIMAGKVLDLCCGTGRLSTWLAKKGFMAVGLDISSLYLKDARKRAREFGVESRVKFFLGDMRKVDEVVGSEGPFECVISFRNSFGFWGDKADEMILAKIRRITRKGGVLVIGECDHLGQLMLSFDKTRVYESKDGVMISEASMDYVSGMFTAVFKYYTREGDVLKYRDSFNYQARIYSVSELSSLLGRAGWKVTKVYESIEGLYPFTHRAIFKGTTSMNIVAKAN